MNEEQIKQAANKYFSEKNYKNSIASLWKLGDVKFIDYGIKRKWFTKKEFVEEFLTHADIFTSIFESKKADELLFSYFTPDKIVSEKFEKKLVAEFPKLYTNAVRVSQVFLREDRHAFLDSLQFSEEYQIHQRVWKKLQRIDNQYWFAIQNNLEKVSKNNIYEILTDAVSWFDEKLQENSRLQDLNHLASVYSFFIELYLQKKKLNNINATKKQIENTHTQSGKIINSNLAELLQNINMWIFFNDTTLSAYSFVLDVTPKEENSIIYFNQLPETYYKWKLDGIRYNVTRNDYLFRYIQPDNIPTKKEDLIYVGKEKLKLFLDDLKIQQLNSTSVENLYTPLLELSVNCKTGFKQKKSEPSFIFFNNEDLTQNKVENLPNISKEVAKQIINLFSFKGKNEFDRFSLKYNVWHQPFADFSGNLFCPKIFLADNDWFYAFAQAGINNLNLYYNKQERKRTTDLMEETLGEKFKEKGWTVKVTTQKDENKMKGDIDVIVEDKYTTLYIQLKRPYFRLNPKDAYYEFMKSDRKAVQQLNDAEEYFSNKNVVFNPKKGNKTVKWITSTSYENILADIEGCIKVNFFDILNVFKRPFGETLQNFIDFINKDKQILNLINIYNSGEPEYEFYAIATAEVGLPVPLEYPSRYRIAMFSDDEKKIEYDKVYEKAIELDKVKKHEKAIHLYYKCLEINSDDIDVHIGLGNAYANTGKCNEAFKAFKGALKVSPKDPYVLREYSSTLMESGKYFEALNTLLNLCELYPFVGDLRYLYEFKYHSLSVMKLLKYEQKIRLKRRWDKLQ